MEEDETRTGELYEGRRATVEDLPRLRDLWREQNLPAVELEKRFTEFQVVVDAEKRIVGAAGLRIAGHQGMIHSEAYADRADAHALRMLLWKRIQKMAQNHGLFRLWALPTVGFYREQGMDEPSEEARGSIPAEFGPRTLDWLTLRLKEEHPPGLSIEQEFAMLAESQRAESASLIRQARMMRVLAYGFLALVLGAFAVLAYLVLRQRSGG